MTEGFLALPICIPGTAVWKAKQGRLYILGVLEKAAAKSKAAMKVQKPLDATIVLSGKTIWYVDESSSWSCFSYSWCTSLKSCMHLSGKDRAGKTLQYVSIA